MRLIIYNMGNSSNIKPAVFLDRDGCVTVEKSYVRRAEDMEIYPFSKPCVDRLHELGYLAIVITNQSGVGRGMFTEEELGRMNDRLYKEVGVDAVYYCPHWYNKESTLPKYNIDCECRKPKTGMIEAAKRDFAAKGITIDIAGSYFAGDRATDLLTGKNAGMKAVLVRTGYGSGPLEADVVPDDIYDNLEEFVKSLG
ncbi:MAG: D-glycero-alpha-D-manno-heptose-1,7-bisphosphate 7-phosphatase [Bacteroides sp.]